MAGKENKIRNTESHLIAPRGHHEFTSRGATMIPKERKGTERTFEKQLLGNV